MSARYTVTPYVAAYVNARLVEIAPRLVAGLDGIAAGVSRIATHFGTLETLQVVGDGTGVRTITAVRFDVGGYDDRGPPRQRPKAKGQATQPGRQGPVDAGTSSSAARPLRSPAPTALVPTRVPTSGTCDGLGRDHAHDRDLVRRITPHYRRADDEARALVQSVLANADDIAASTTELRVTFALPHHAAVDPRP